jgi:hypothetical protein
LEYFKKIEKHPFMLSHCWVKLKNYPKWKECFAAWHKHSSKKSKKCANDPTIDLEEDGTSKTSQAMIVQEDTKLERTICGDRLYPLP